RDDQGKEDQPQRSDDAPADGGQQRTGRTLFGGDQMGLLQEQAQPAGGGVGGRAGGGGKGEEAGAQDEPAGDLLTSGNVALLARLIQLSLRWLLCLVCLVLLAGHLRPQLSCRANASIWPSQARRAAPRVTAKMAKPIRMLDGMAIKKICAC